jgi:CheY-like chemotaxis protein
MTSPPGHRILVVEDNADERADVCALLESLGESVRAVETVEEALAAIEEEELCGYVFDQALPLKKGAADFVTGGERIVRAARAKDRRRSDEGGDVTPIIAFTSYSEKASFVTGLFEAGITTFVMKPLRENQAYFVEKYRGAFARAGRGDHGKCAALGKQGAGTGPGARDDGSAAPVRLAVDGKATKGGRTAITVNGEQRQMRDKSLTGLLRCIVARDRGLDVWTARAALGVGESRAETTRLREPFEGLAPAGFDVIETDRRGSLRLNPAVVVERVDWDVLFEHPDPGVARVASERRKRQGGR